MACVWEELNIIYTELQFLFELAFSGRNENSVRDIRGNTKTCSLQVKEATLPSLTGLLSEHTGGWDLECLINSGKRPQQRRRLGQVVKLSSNQIFIETLSHLRLPDGGSSDLKPSAASSPCVHAARHFPPKPRWHFARC